MFMANYDRKKSTPLVHPYDTSMFLIFRRNDRARKEKRGKKKSIFIDIEDLSEQIT